MKSIDYQDVDDASVETASSVGTKNNQLRYLLVEKSSRICTLIRNGINKAARNDG